MAAQVTLCSGMLGPGADLTRAGSAPSLGCTSDSQLNLTPARMHPEGPPRVRVAGAPSRPTLSAAGRGAPQKTGRSLHLEAVALSSKGGTKADTVTAVSQELARKDQGWSVLQQRPFSRPRGSHGESFTSKA